MENKIFTIILILIMSPMWVNHNNYISIEDTIENETISKDPPVPQNIEENNINNITVGFVTPIFTIMAYRQGNFYTYYKNK